MNMSHSLGYEHLTLIPKAFADQRTELQALNPHTKIFVIDNNLMTEWPNSPSVLIEGPLNRLEYIGPLGFGV